MDKTLPSKISGMSLRPVDNALDIEDTARGLIDYGVERIGTCIPGPLACARDGHFREPCRKWVAHCSTRGCEKPADVGATSARVDVEILLAHALGCSRAELYMKRAPVDGKEKKVFGRFLSERMNGRPLQYILGSVSFMGCELKVREGIFIPRPETELLVEAALRILKDSHLSNPLLLDIGTGCGNISIALTIYNSGCKIISTDISQEAITLSIVNAGRLGVLERIDFEVDDLWPRNAPFKEVDMIISNPPYIPTKELKGLPREVRFEPDISLDGKEEGVFYHRRIIQQAPKLLRGSGWLLLELGYDEAPLLKEEIVRTIGMRYIALIRDYNGLPRIIIARRAKNG